MQRFKSTEERKNDLRETPPSSPSLRRPRRSLLHSQSLRIKPTVHQPQCTCDASLATVLAQHIPFLSVRVHSRGTCSRFQPWRQRCVDSRAESSYSSLLAARLDTKEHSANLHQIELDLSRTYPDEPFFMDRGAGREALKRLLIAFTNYDPTIGYVQGMNFIAAALLWHCSEVDSFWLFVHLMEDYDLRDNYCPQLPGLAKHCQIVNLVLMEHLPKLHLLFCEYRIAVEVFITDWCFTLFGSLVPLQEMGALLSDFYRLSWSFFYRVVLVILRRLQSRLLQSADVSEVLSCLRPPSKSQRHWREFVRHLEHGRESLDWSRLLLEADQLEIDDTYIKRLHFGFCLDTSRFGRLE